MAHSTNENPVEWPARAVVTAGMPYGNKPLHFGHAGGVFVPADAFARFLRDRIGKDNVRFVSGTDCFGSPINEGYRKLVEAGEFDGSISDYVMRNHERQANTLRSYGISLSIYDGSGIGHAGEVHQHVSEAFIEKLHENGFLRKESTLQFYDTEAQTFLNGSRCISGTPEACSSRQTRSRASCGTASARITSDLSREPTASAPRSTRAIESSSRRGSSTGASPTT